MRKTWTRKYRYAKIVAYEHGLIWHGGPEAVYPSLEGAGFKWNWRTNTWDKIAPSLTEKQRKVLELLVFEGGHAGNYFVMQLCGLYADSEKTIDTLKERGLITATVTRDKSWYSITIDGRNVL
jgi:hypothetical protein